MGLKSFLQKLGIMQKPEAMEMEETVVAESVSEPAMPAEPAEEAEKPMSEPAAEAPATSEPAEGMGSSASMDHNASADSADDSSASMKME